MIKIWKIKKSSDIKLCFKQIGMPDNYIELLLEDGSELLKYLKTSNYFYIVTNLNDYNRWSNGFGWFEFEYFLEYTNSHRPYEYFGEVNLRKEKLLKLNEIFK